MEDALRRLQLCELEILDEFVRVCKKLGLRYYLTGGTLLGALRHKGFIPWDDDIDVAMLREDYDRFAEAAAQELDERYFYQSPQTDPHYFLTYAKIRKNGTTVYEERFKDAKFHKGVFIDIFPLDFCPAPGPVCHFLFNVLAVMNRRGEADSGATIEPYEELSGKIGYAALRPLSASGLVKMRRQLLRLSERLSDKSFVASYSGAYGFYKEVYQWNLFERQNQLEFEGRRISVSENPEAQTRQVYGDHYEIVPNVKPKGHICLEESSISGT